MNDLNTFSAKDKGNDEGYAARIQVDRADTIRVSQKLLQLKHMPVMNG